MSEDTVEEAGQAYTKMLEVVADTFKIDAALAPVRVNHLARKGYLIFTNEEIMALLAAEREDARAERLR